MIIGWLTADGAFAGTTVNAIAGATFDGLSARIGILEARVPVSTHWTVAPALVYFEGEAGYHESQLRLSMTGAFEAGTWIIDNRHMLSMSTESVERYRARLRFARPGLLGESRLSARAFDEAFFDFDAGRLIRNNLAAGLGLTVDGTITAELYHVWVNNIGARDDTYVLALLTVRLGTRH
jgi:hypothetical protein